MLSRRLTEVRDDDAVDRLMLAATVDSEADVAAVSDLPIRVSARGILFTVNEVAGTGLSDLAVNQIANADLCLNAAVCPGAIWETAEHLRAESEVLPIGGEEPAQGITTFVAPLLLIPRPARMKLACCFECHSKADLERQLELLLAPKVLLREVKLPRLAVRMAAEVVATQGDSLVVGFHLFRN